MFERLQKKWKVNGLQLTLILFTFAIGGSLTGFVGKKIMNALAIQYDWLWTIIYIILITLLWPMAVLLVSIFFGQFRFFLSYIKKIGARVGLGQSAASSRHSTVDSQQSAVGSQQSAVGSQQSAVGSQQSTVDSQQSAVGSQQSAVGSQQSEVK